jgi:plasmid stabilization system protein ParE
MRIRWTNAAAADMQGISDYLKDNHSHYRQPTLFDLLLHWAPRQATRHAFSFKQSTGFS